MFTHLRESAQGFFAKAILVLLAAMFVLWGIGDALRGIGGPSGDVATVGRKAITVQQVRNAVSRSHRPVQEVIFGLVNDALVAQEAQASGIEVSDDEVARYIGALAEFQGGDGKFDKALYKRMLAESGTDETHFVEETRHEITARLLLDSLVNGGQVSDALLAWLYKSQGEQRAANLLFIPLSAAEAGIPAPGAQEIQAYYAAHAGDFMAPETRSVTYVSLPLADVMAGIEVPENEIKHAYEDRIQELHQPEKRQVEQMVFKTEAEAKKAAAQIASGATFDSVARSAGVLNKDKLSLGEVSQAELSPEAAGAGIFTLKEGGVSAPAHSDFGWHLFRVSKIIPEGPLPLAQARAAIAKEIAGSQAQETMQKLVNALQDALAGGASLEQAAEKIGQKTHALGPVTQNGEGPDGRKADVPPYKTFLNVAFTTAEKEHSQAAQADDGSYFLLRVDTITPQHAKPLEQVKDAVAKAALADKARARLEKLMQAITEQARSGKTPEEVLHANGISVSPMPSGRLLRDSAAVPEGPLKDKKLPRALLSELFHLRTGASTHPYPVGDGGYLIASPTQIIPPPEPPDAKNLQEFRADLKTTLSNETLHAYLVYLHSKYPVSLNVPPSLRKEMEGE